MADLIVVTGPPGSGKTTVSRVLSGLYEQSARVSGDDFFTFIDQGYTAPWTPAAHRQNEVVISAAAAAAGRLAAGGYTVVYDGVIRPWSIDAFGRTANTTRLHYAVLLPPERVCVRRVQSRIGHGFTDLDATRHMHAEFADAKINSCHVLVNPAEATELAAHIQQLVRDGSIAWPINSPPTCPS